jgi:molybdopterin synthase sulfur carrier subunit
MFARISIPPTLRRLCGGDETLYVRPGPLGDVLDQLHERFNGVRDRLCDADGRVRGSVVVFVNEQDVRFLDGERTPVRSGDEVTIIPAFAGG